MVKKTKEIWVFIEQTDSMPADVSFELLSKGSKLADSFGGVLKAVVIGYQVKNLAKETFRYGAEEVMVIDHPHLQNYHTLAYSRILNKLVLKHQPRIFLFGATFVGRDLAPRIASHTRSGLTADCTELQISNVKYLRQDYKELLLQIRPAFGGNIIATIISPDTTTQMATVREGVMELCPLAEYREGKITAISYQPVPQDNLIKLIKKHRENKQVNIKGSPVIVAGGYGMGSKDNFQILHDFAHTIGGEVAGSRAAVDAGFISPDRQVGQTGVTVRPKLYIACGISGAIQHRAGMQHSQKIIAINNDPDAPIFDFCHYGVVGDVMDVIPKFIDSYKHKLR